ncbi:hypothetical protein BD408DRAFT_346324 [Parasitella parasitica]|nr:hypothetical protein BD408DRAFT_346324 [Parasitella parasitica]
MFAYIFTLLICLVCVLTRVQGFCIYNYSKDTTFHVRQEPLNTGGTYFSRFQVKSLGPGEKACCPYTSFDCNRSGGVDDQIQIAVSFLAF